METNSKILKNCSLDKPTTYSSKIDWISFTFFSFHAINPLATLLRINGILLYA